MYTARLRVHVLMLLIAARASFIGPGMALRGRSYHPPGVVYCSWVRGSPRTGQEADAVPKPCRHQRERHLAELGRSWVPVPWADGCAL